MLSYVTWDHRRQFLFFIYIYIYTKQLQKEVSKFTPDRVEEDRSCLPAGGGGGGGGGGPAAPSRWRLPGRALPAAWRTCSSLPQPAGPLLTYASRSHDEPLRSPSHSVGCPVLLGQVWRSLRSLCGFSPVCFP